MSNFSFQFIKKIEMAFQVHGFPLLPKKQTIDLVVNCVLNRVPKWPFVLLETEKTNSVK